MKYKWLMKYEKFCGSRLYLIGLLEFLAQCLALTETDRQLIGDAVRQFASGMKHIPSI